VVHDVNTIKDTVKRARSEGLPLTENFIRVKIAEGLLRHNKVGRKILVFYPNLLRLLEKGDASTETDAGGGVTRQSERLR
jgi:hypothetical protein